MSLALADFFPRRRAKRPGRTLGGVNRLAREIDQIPFSTPREESEYSWVLFVPSEVKPETLDKWASTPLTSNWVATLTPMRPAFARTCSRICVLWVMPPTE